MVWFAIAAMWISVSAAAIYGIHITGTSTPLWAFIIPALMFVDHSEEGDAE